MNSNTSFTDHCTDGNNDNLPRLFEVYFGSKSSTCKPTCVCKHEGIVIKKKMNFLWMMIQRDIVLQVFVNLERKPHNQI